MWRLKSVGFVFTPFLKLKLGIRKGVLFRYLNIQHYEVVIVASRLTDKQKKKIIADYVELGSYNAVAKENGVTRQTVKNIISKDTEIGQKLQDKKDKNTLDILSHMEEKKDKVNQIIDTYLDQLLDPDTIKKATPSQLTTALGTLIDKFTIAKVTNTGKTQEDDPLTKAFREEAERMNNANIK